MRSSFIAAATALSGALLFLGDTFAQTPPAETTPIAENPPAPSPATELAVTIERELGAVFERANIKYKNGARTEAEFADDLRALDELSAKYAATKTDEAAMIGAVKAYIYLEILEDTPAGIVHLQTVKRDFPDTKVAAEIAPRLATLELEQAIAAATAVGQPFPSFNEMGTDGTPVDLAAYKGKVVLIDFWATWCGPCVDQLPTLIETHKKYHDQGFEIIGISLDKDRAALGAFAKKNPMPWPQVSDGLGWQSKLVRSSGVRYIPATFLLDRDGTILAKDLHGEDLLSQVASALAKKAE